MRIDVKYRQKAIEIAKSYTDVAVYFEPRYFFDFYCDNNWNFKIPILQFNYPLSIVCCSCGRQSKSHRVTWGSLKLKVAFSKLLKSSHVIINVMRMARTVCNIQITFPIFSNGFFTFGTYAVLHWFTWWWRKWSSNQWIRNWVNHWRGVTSSRIVIIKWMVIWRRHKCIF